MKRILGLVLGLSLLGPTLHYEQRLITRVTTALNTESAPPTNDVSPPFDPGSALTKLRSLVDLHA